MQRTLSRLDNKEGHGELDDIGHGGVISKNDNDTSFIISPWEKNWPKAKCIGENHGFGLGGFDVWQTRCWWPVNLDSKSILQLLAIVPASVAWPIRYIWKWQEYYQLHTICIDYCSERWISDLVIAIGQTLPEVPSEMFVNVGIDTLW